MVLKKSFFGVCVCVCESKIEAFVALKISKVGPRIKKNFLKTSAYTRVRTVIAKTLSLSEAELF